MSTIIRTCHAAAALRSITGSIVCRRAPALLLLFVMLSGMASAQPVWELVTKGMAVVRDVHAFAFDDAGVPYVATSEGIYRFDAAIGAWRVVSSRVVQGVAFGSDGSIIGLPVEGGIARSVDGGQSWNRTLETADLLYKVMRAPDGSLFATTRLDFYRSDNSGQSWKKLSIDSDPLMQRFVRAADGSLLSFGWDTLRYSTDNGDSWQPAAMSPRLQFSIVRLAANDDIVGIAGGLFYRSTDNGRTWTAEKKIDLSIIDVVDDGTMYGMRHDLPGEGIYQSVTNGFLWRQISARTPERFAVAPGGALWIVDNDSILTSNDKGATWSPGDRGLPGISPISSIMESPDGSLVATVNTTLYRSIDNGDNWSFIGPERGSELVGIDSAGNIYARYEEIRLMPGYENRYIHLKQWRPDSAVWRDVPGHGGYRDIALGGPRLLAASFSEDGTMGSSYSGGVSISRDGGATWERTSFDLPSNIVAVSPQGTLLAGMYEYGCMFSDAGLYISRDSGTTWSQRFDSLQITFLDVAPNGFIYLAGTQYYFDSTRNDIDGYSVFLRSTDDGVTWQSILDRVYVTRLSVASSGDLFYGSNWDTFFSSDGGESWKKFDLPYRQVLGYHLTLPSGEHIVRVDTVLHRMSADATTWRSIQFNLPGDYGMVVVATRSGYLFASTARGVYRMPILSAGVDENAAPVPHLHLGAPRPNPAATSSSIPLELFAPEHLRVTLTDLLGRELRVIHDGMLPAGATELRVERRDLSAGAYLLLVQSRGGVASRVLIIE